MTLRIGVHPSNPTLDTFARSAELQKPLVEAGVDYQIVRYPDGVETVDLFRIGAIDVSGTGFTPPITLLSEGVDVVFLATSAPRAGEYGGGLVVRADSGITSVADLRGRSVSLALGSWQTSSLAFSLEQGGLSWADVTPVRLSVPAALYAFRNGDLDAWVIDEPTLSKVRSELDVTVLVPTADVLSHPSVFFGTRAAAAEQADAVRVLLEALDATDAWIEANPDEAAALLVEGTLRSESDALASLTTRPWGLRLPTAEFLEEEERAGALLHRFGVLPSAPQATAAVPASAPFTPRNH
ncbi:ABC transporter substrate-binding protein [Nocardioides sp. CER19]|uniref:ABC transporter substrate-binding protein n=1 Tax=Nocardioides sp. CER19 TaxID=3038538 RepID=UPI00244A2B15|nr:ABC transporter substrate-binding protein [Nocardioides sp. CER19]MDH2415202.1 ABC transporter substrate-binding protein [Nocardioides sp. CER19]